MRVNCLGARLAEKNRPAHSSCSLASLRMMVGRRFLRADNTVVSVGLSQHDTRHLQQVHNIGCLDQSRSWVAGALRKQQVRCVCVHNQVDGRLRCIEVAANTCGQPAPIRQTTAATDSPEWAGCRLSRPHTVQGAPALSRTRAQAPRLHARSRRGGARRAAAARRRGARAWREFTRSSLLHLSVRVTAADEVCVRRPACG